MEPENNKEFIAEDVPDEWIKEDKIQYKWVSDKVFTKRGYKAEKVILEKTGDYLSEEIKAEIDREQENTIIVNVGTGGGKSRAAEELMREYYDKKYKIIIANPFKSLVEKSHEYLSVEQKIPRSDVFDYRQLDSDKELFKSMSSEKRKTYLQGLVEKPIQVMTINSLLGNPGDNAFIQTKGKIMYLDALYEYCEKESIKIVFFFDEIHEAIPNFKNEFLYILHRWRPLAHKCFILTATFTEPSYIVSMHIAYLTNDTVKIIEAPRDKNPEERLADLELYFCRENYSSKKGFGELDYIKEFIKKNEHPRYHILSYSEKIAKELAESLSEVMDVNLTIGSKDEDFNNKLNNIGTTFKTGVNIREQDAFIIITPAQYGNHFETAGTGIFYDGVPSILQSFARLRNGGKILVFIPPVKNFINTLKKKDREAGNLQYTDYLKDTFHFLKDIPTKAKNPEFSAQKGKIEKAYSKLYERIKGQKIQYDSAQIATGKYNDERDMMKKRNVLMTWLYLNREAEIRNSFRKSLIDKIEAGLSDGNGGHKVDMKEMRFWINDTYRDIFDKDNSTNGQADFGAKDWDAKYNFNYKELNAEMEVHEQKILRAGSSKHNDRSSKLIRPLVQYPDIDTYILAKGQQYLAWSEEKYGKAISPYIIWAAFHDQFQNCRLTRILSHRYKYIKLEIDSSKKSNSKAPFGNAVDKIKAFLEKYYRKDIMKSLKKMHPYEAVYSCLKMFTNEVNVNGKDYKIMVVLDDVDKHEGFKHSTTFYQWLFSLLYRAHGRSFSLSSTNYILGNFHLAKKAKSENRTPLGKAYYNLGTIGQLFYNAIQEKEAADKTKVSLPLRDYEDFCERLGRDFMEEQYDNIIRCLESIKKGDKFIRNRKISFLQNLSRATSKEQEKDLMYVAFKKVFLIESEERHRNGRRLYTYCEGLKKWKYHWFEPLEFFRLTLPV